MLSNVRVCAGCGCSACIGIVGRVVASGLSPVGAVIVITPFSFIPIIILIVVAIVGGSGNGMGM